MVWKDILMTHMLRDNRIVFTHQVRSLYFSQDRDLNGKKYTRHTSSSMDYYKYLIKVWKEEIDP